MPLVFASRIFSLREFYYHLLKTPRLTQESRWDRIDALAEKLQQYIDSQMI